MQNYGNWLARLKGGRPVNTDYASRLSVRPEEDAGKPPKRTGRDIMRVAGAGGNGSAREIMAPNAALRRR